ncbi:MAG: hypothetical protein M8357_09370 [Desulfobulbaceae bacterium]|nr:hypothetical protein [Desulfobulbaceae bacterium]
MKREYQGQKIEGFWIVILIIQYGGFVRPPSGQNSLNMETRDSRILFAILANAFFAFMFFIGINMLESDVLANDSVIRWQIVNVDSAGDVGKYTSIALNNLDYAMTKLF